MSMISDRNCLFRPGSLDRGRIKVVAFCRNLARGWGANSSESTDMSSSELEGDVSESPDPLLLFFFFERYVNADGYAHSGVG